MRHVKRLRLECVLIALALSVSLGLAQPVVAPPGYSVNLMASGLVTPGEHMAVDRWGNVYIVSQNPYHVIQVTAQGIVNQVHCYRGGGTAGLGYNPADGYVYTHEENPTCDNFLRIEPSGGATAVGPGITEAHDVAADNQGRLLVANVSGTYRLDALGSLSLISPYAGHWIEVLANDEILFGWYGLVRSFNESSGTTVPLVALPAGQEVRGLARGTLNQLGSGFLVATSQCAPPCSSGVLAANHYDLSGGSQAALASTGFAPPFSDKFTVATDIHGSIYWLEEEAQFSYPNPQTFKLYRIDPIPTAGIPGSLLATTQTGQLSLQIYGPVAGGDPFLLGAIATPAQPVPPLFLGSYGIIDLDPFSPAYAALLDGLGFFHSPPDPAVTGAGGLYGLAVSIPLSLAGLAFEAQFVLPSALAPNMAFFVSNVAPIVLQ